MDEQYIISIHDLNLHFGRQQVLKNINTVIPRNKITVILGPSGCGKTTLLRCLNRLSDLNEGVKTSGSIVFHGENILAAETDVISIRKKMGLLSQRPYPLPMSIFDNVAYGIRLHNNLKRKELREKVEFYLKKAELWDEVKDRLREPAARLSIGQQQRLCLARGLAVEPEIILADEPTSALDPISSAAIEKEFSELKNDYTIIIVTHILRQARRLADHVIFLYLGEIVEQGNAADFFNNPKDERTKNYLKGMFN
jgi:phosphate transport system ATP-binding protein